MIEVLEVAGGQVSENQSDLQLSTASNSESFTVVSGGRYKKTLTPKVCSSHDEEALLDKELKELSSLSDDDNVWAMSFRESMYGQATV